MYSKISKEIYAKDIIIKKANESTRNIIKNKSQIFELTDVIIYKKLGLISDKNGKLISETCNEHVFWHPKIIDYSDQDAENRLKYFQEIIDNIDVKNKLIIDSNVDCIYLVHPFEWYAYGHLFDTLQRLYNLKERKFQGPYLICSDYSRVNDFGSHIEKLGYRKDFIIPFHGFFDAIHVKRLIYSESPANVTQFTDFTKNGFGINMYLSTILIPKIICFSLTVEE